MARSYLLSLTKLIRIAFCCTVLILCLLAWFGKSRPPPPTLPSKMATIRRRLSPHVTVVTAFWSVGNSTTVRNGNVTRHDLESLAYVTNPVVAYFDDKNIAASFEETRIGLLTKIVILERGSLWAFRQQSNISAALSHTSQSGAALSSTLICVTYSKYDVLSLAIESNYFGSETFVWLDVTYYREMIGQHGHAFRLTAPPYFMEDNVAFNAPCSRQPYTVAHMFAQGRIWVNSDLIIGNAKQLATFCDEFRREAIKYLTHGLVNTDEQVIYAMFSEYNADVPLVKIQEYRADTHFDQFHYLGILLREIWYKKIKPLMN